MHIPLNLILDMATESEAIGNLIVELWPKVVELFDFYDRKLHNSAIPCTFGFRGRSSILNE